MIDPKTLSDKSTEELSKILAEKRRELSNFRFGVSGSKVRNVKEGSVVKKDIARVLTALRHAADKK